MGDELHSSLSILWNQILLANNSDSDPNRNNTKQKKKQTKNFSFIQ